VQAVSVVVAVAPLPIPTTAVDRAANQAICTTLLSTQVVDIPIPQTNLEEPAPVDHTQVKGLPGHTTEPKHLGKPLVTGNLKPLLPEPAVVEPVVGGMVTVLRIVSAEPEPVVLVEVPSSWLPTETVRLLSGLV
jgi:hypothetical protein